MLISALNQYYEVLNEKNRLPAPGYDDLDVSYLVALKENGSLAGLIDIRESKEDIDKKGKVKTSLIPQKMQMPERIRSTKVNSNYVENRGSYIFGLEYRINSDTKEGFLSTESKGQTPKTRAKLALQHQDFVKEVNRDFEGINSPIVKAYRLFSKNWKPEEETENSELLKIKKDLNTAKFAFCLENDQTVLLQDDPMVKANWSKISQESNTKDESSSQCAISGKDLPIARLHDVLKAGKGIGVRDAGINPSLVNFNCDSFESYGHKQGQNACISGYVMKRYTSALNWLLASPCNHGYLSGLTLVFWSQDGNQANDKAVAASFGFSDDYSPEELDDALKHIVEDMEKGTVTERRLRAEEAAISPNTDYYLVCLVPNASRIQIKFIYRQKFGKILYNIARHQADMRINKKEKPVPLWRLKKEMTSPKTSTPESNDAPFSTIFRSILLGTEYPSWCLSTMIRRIRTDHNSEENHKIRMNDVRVGFIKACLIRHTKEEISMALDKTNTNPAYLCGRLFAVLQEIQEDSAQPAVLNRTIEDAYFTAASTNPAAVMPKLIRLSHHHMAKLQKNNKGWAVNDSRKLDEIIDKLGTDFPRTLSLYDQGRFILGYYQQSADKYKSKQNQEEE